MLFRAHPRSLAAAVLAIPVLVCTGCNLNTIMATRMGDMAEDSAPKFAGYWDTETVLDGVPGAIMQLEAMRYVAPKSEGLNLELLRSYVAYAQGRAEVAAERHAAAGDTQASARQAQRAALLYTRARDLGLRLMSHRDEAIVEVSKWSGATLTTYLSVHYGDRDDLEPLYWTAVAWGSLITLAPEAASAGDVERVRAMANHVVGLHPGYRLGGALAVLGSLSCAAAGQGADAKAGSAYFEQALKLTERRAHALHVEYARECALRGQQRDLYEHLLKEIIEAKDLGNDVRLANNLARRRAEWYLSRVGEDFAASGS